MVHGIMISIGLFEQTVMPHYCLSLMHGCAIDKKPTSLINAKSHEAE